MPTDFVIHGRLHITNLIEFIEEVVIVGRVMTIGTVHIKFQKAFD